MKTKLIALLSAILLFGGLSLNAQNKKKNSKEEVTYNVSMTCDNCKRRIERNIAFEKGVSDLKVDLSDKTVWLQYQTNKTDTVKLKKAIEKLGYTATVHR